MGGAYTWPEFQQCIREQIQLNPYSEWLRYYGAPDRGVAIPVEDVDTKCARDAANRVVCE